MCWYSASNEWRSTTCGSRATPTFVVVLDNVFFPCGPVEAMSPGRQGCVDDESPGYNGRVDETQMRWLAHLLAEVPRDRLVVIAHHIPLVSFVDGLHVVTVSAVDRHGRPSTERMAFEVRATRPAPH